MSYLNIFQCVKGKQIVGKWFTADWIEFSGCIRIARQWFQIRFSIGLLHGYCKLCIRDIWVSSGAFLIKNVIWGTVPEKAIILCMCPAKERRCYIVTLSLIGLVHTQNDPWECYPDSKDHGANMGPIWVLSAPDGPHVGPMYLAIRVAAMKLTEAGIDLLRPETNTAVML